MCDVMSLVVVILLSVVCRQIDAASITSTPLPLSPSSMSTSSSFVTVAAANSSQSSRSIVDGATSLVTSDAQPIEMADRESTISAESVNTAECVLVPIDPYQHVIIANMVVEQQLNLIQYVLLFPRSSVNPLTVNLTRALKGNSFSRVSTSHGQTLLSLAFNYGILSLMTLTIGTEQTVVELEERPAECLLQMPEDAKLELVVDLLMRDFRTSPGSNQLPQPKLLRNGEIIEEVTFRGEERVCYEIVTDNGNGYARFTDYCCYRDRIHGQIECDKQYANGWLKFLYVMLMCIRFGVLAFGPLMFLSTVSGLVREEFPYTVHLKDPLIKTIVVYRTDSGGGGSGQPLPAVEELKGRHRIDLRNMQGFPKLTEMVMNNLDMIGRPFRAKFTQYDILVSYKRLLTENKVPVGFWRSIVRAIFFCKLRHVAPFQKCCRTDILRQRHCRQAAEGCCGKSAVRGKIQWIQIWRRVGLALLILLLPTPYYVRLCILYYFEYDELIARKEAAQRQDLHEYFENSLVHYFLPTSPLFITIYVVYGVMAINLAYLARRTEKGRFRKIIIGSFTDLKNLSWLNVLQMMVSNVIWPFQRYGLAGCLVVLIYWPIVLPLTSLVYAFYCLPTVYLTVRMFFYSKLAFLRRIEKRSGKKIYQVKRKVDNSVQIFECGNLLGNGSDDEDEAKKNKDAEAAAGQRRSVYDRSASTRSTSRFWNIRESVLNSEEVDNVNVTNVNRDKVPGVKRSGSNTSSLVIDRMASAGGRLKHIIEHCMASALCVATLYAVLVVMSECVGCFVEILVFTLMGIIVNAGTLLKYVALVVMLIVYSYDCFNNVEKKYLKLNRALFGEVKGRIKDLDKVTSLPSFLQENCGFKSQELGEQAEYELPDDITDKPSRHWRINDLVLFIDNEDMPRIPRKLFEDVCRIRVAGVPGPVYQGQLMALRQFLRIVVFIFFVFVVILSFSSITKLQVSSTNQMIAALAGGSLPFILRMVMEPEKPEIEIGTVSFKNQLDEVIKNFVQYWPIYDLPFELYTAEDEERDRKLAEEKKHKAEGGGGDGGTLERPRNVFDGGRPRSFDRGQAGDLLRNPFVFDDHIATNNNMGDCVDDGGPAAAAISGNHVVVMRHSKGGFDDDNERQPRTAETPKPKVSFAGELNDKCKPEPDVDIVIYLPMKSDGIWLDQSSDCDRTDVDALDEETGGSSDDDAEVFRMNETKYRASIGVEQVDGPPKNTDSARNSRPLLRL